MAWFDDLNLPGSTIDGFFGYVTADGSDENDNPDVMLADGTVTFTATTPAARVNGAWLGIQSVTAKIFEGRLVVSEEEPLPIRLLATDANIGVADWAWKATFDVKGFRLSELTFKAPRNTTVNLTADLIPIKSQPYQIIEGASIVDTEVDTVGERMRFKMSDGTFTSWVNVPNGEPGAKGDPGGKGDPGNDGQAATLAMGVVSTGANADAWMTGTPAARELNLALPRGPKGDKGDGSSWAEVTGKPTSFPSTVPSVSGLQAALDAKLSVEAVELGTENLDTITTPKIYYQTQSSEASTALNYPVAQAGALTVTANASRSQVQQAYTTFLTSTPQRFWRTYYNAVWSTWRQSVDTTDPRLSPPTWAGVTGKPVTFPPDAHNHDDRYYTETEVNALISSLSPYDSGVRNIAGLLNAGFSAAQVYLWRYANTVSLQVVNLAYSGSSTGLVPVLAFPLGLRPPATTAGYTNRGQPVQATAGGVLQITDPVPSVTSFSLTFLTSNTPPASPPGTAV